MGGGATRTEATLEDWAAADAAAMRSLEPEFDAQWRGLDTSEQKTLRAILLGDGLAVPLGGAPRLELTKDVVRRALPRLAATAEIEEREEGGYAIVDPLFAPWIDRLNDPPDEADEGYTEPDRSRHPREARDQARRESLDDRDRPVREPRHRDLPLVLLDGPDDRFRDPRRLDHESPQEAALEDSLLREPLGLDEAGQH